MLHLPLLFIVLVPVLVLIVDLLFRSLRPCRLPKLHIVGARTSEWFPILRATWRNSTDMAKALDMAYKQYKNCACILPVLGQGNLVVLPTAEAQWLVDQPDAAIGALEQFLDILQTDLTVPEPGLLHNPIQPYTPGASRQQANA